MTALLGFAGWSGSGKTTLIEKLIPVLMAKGLRISVIKHDVHGLSEDDTGKDSQRFIAAGAQQCILCGPERPPETLVEALKLVKKADLVIVEGFKRAPISRIGVARSANGKGFTDDPECFAATVCDAECPERAPGYIIRQAGENGTCAVDVPGFDINDTERIADFIMKNMDDFSHFDENGNVWMVNVGDKPVTKRTAKAAASVLVNRSTFDLIKSGGMKKGNVLAAARIAGIMGSKRTSDLIPLCHPIVTDGTELSLILNEERCSVDITSEVRCSGRTGVEMEALTAVSVAALTVYDMCKAVQRDIRITDIRLTEKEGGTGGTYRE